ncbi:MAG: right-handed parallel beta-helix repeat-containing protein [Planctomycetota bacterium]|nr:MAG: right-handed parallel beta-helix repeat-containing protein [Planctomycetota bacterium]
MPDVRYLPVIPPRNHDVPPPVPTFVFPALKRRSAVSLRSGSLGGIVCCALTTVIALMPSITRGEQAVLEIHVAVDGDDSAAGTAEAPLASLEAARDRLRQLKPQQGAVVWLHGGRYVRTRSFDLTAEDSGRPNAPIVYKAVPGETVIFDGGRRIDASAFRPVIDENIVRRLPENARGRVVWADLRKLGIDDLGRFGPRGFGRPTFSAPPELFVDGEPMRIAVWPNPGEPWIPLGEVLDKGSVPRKGETDNRPGVFRYVTPRAERWVHADDLFIQGFFAWGFAEDTVGIARIDTEQGTFTTDGPHLYGFGGGRQPNLWVWRAVNLLEEIDLPGEYYIDRQNGYVYLLPPKPLQEAAIWISLLEEPFVEAQGPAHVRFEGIVFEYARGNGLVFHDAEDVEVAGCTLRNLGLLGISMIGTRCRVRSCDVYQTGAGGVRISGGDRRRLVPGENCVENCDIHHVNRWYRNYRPCVAVSGVGNVVRHNHLHDCPGQAITMAGNDHIVEFNHIHHVVGEMSDQGAIYMGRNPSDAGNVFRYNYFHHTASTHEKSYGNSGIFFDDGDSGQIVVANVFYKTGKNGAVKYHGGQYNTFVNNIVIDCDRTVTYQLWDQERWDAFLADENMQRRLFRDVDIGKPPFSERYPHLKKLFDEPYSRDTHIEERNYATTADDPLFLDGTKGDFRVRDWKTLAGKVPGFEPIPLEKIGLYRDAFRRDVVPVWCAGE